MKIYFKSIPGLDSAIIWDYDESLNRAIYTPPVNSLKHGKVAVFEMPQGMEMEEMQFVINDVKTFAKSHPYNLVGPSPKIPKSRPNPSNLSIIPEDPHNQFVLTTGEKVSDNTFVSSTTSERGFFAKSKQSSSSSQSSPEPSIRRSSRAKLDALMKLKTQCSLEATDYPSSLRLTDLINSDFNLSSFSETIAYRTLCAKKGREKTRAASFLRDNQYFQDLIEMPLQHYQLKVELLDSIEALLELFNVSYQEFCTQTQLTHKIRKEITDYFCQAIIQTMANGEFKKAPTEFQAEMDKGKDSLFKSSEDACAYFNTQALELRLQALQLNWLVLINDKMTISQSTACSLNSSTQTALHNFKIFLSGGSQTMIQEKIRGSLQEVKSKLFELVIFEQKQAAAIQLYRSSREKKEEPFPGYSSLSTVLGKLFATHLKPMPFDMHFIIQKALVSKILRDIIIKLASNTELEQEKYFPFMAKITIYSAELYIDTGGLEKIQEGLDLIPSEKKIKKKLSKLCSGSLSEINTTIEELVPLCSRIIYETIFSQLKEFEHSSQLTMSMM